MSASVTYATPPVRHETYGIVSSVATNARAPVTMYERPTTSYAAAPITGPSASHPRGSYMTEKIRKDIIQEFSETERHAMWDGCGEVTEVPFVVERDIVVEVPEIHHIVGTTYHPVYEESEVCVEELIPQVTHREELVVQAVEETQIVEKPVKQVTIIETDKPVAVTKIKEEPEILVDVPIVVPTVDVVIERPIVEVDCKVHRVTGCIERIRDCDEVVEVPCEVVVPRIVPKAVPQTEITYVDQVVPHIRRIENVIEVPKEERIQKVVELQQTNTKKTIRHVPKFVDNGCRSPQPKTAEDIAEEELHTARFQLQELELQKAELRCQLELRDRQIIEQEGFLESELRIRSQLEEQLSRVQGCYGKQFGCAIKPCPTETVTTVTVLETDTIITGTTGIRGSTIGATHCEWMFADAASGLLGFQEFAHLNPLRWSASIPMKQAMSEIQIVKSHRDRPIALKIQGGEVLRFVGCQAALDHLQTFVLAETVNVNRASDFSTTGIRRTIVS